VGQSRSTAGSRGGKNREGLREGRGWEVSA